MAPSIATGSSAAAQSQNMSIIDSLKRLERIGSEESDTVRKIIKAANELAQTIVRNAPESRCNRTIQRSIDNEGHAHAAPIPPGTKSPFAAYVIQNQTLTVCAQGCAQPVGASRTAALMFSEDLSRGLLDVFNKLVAKEHETSSKGLDMILAPCPHGREAASGGDSGRGASPAMKTRRCR